MALYRIFLHVHELVLFYVVITCRLLCAQVSDCVSLQVGNVFLGILLKHGAASPFNHHILDSFVYTVFSDIFVKPINTFQLFNSLLDFIYVNQKLRQTTLVFVGFPFTMMNSSGLANSSKVSSVFSNTNFGMMCVRTVIITHGQQHAVAFQNET